jgi:hypothetical protein
MLGVIDPSKSTMKLVFNFALLSSVSDSEKVGKQIEAFIADLADQFLIQIKNLKKDDSFRLTDLIVEGRTDFLLKALQP